jgi:hypothetical protein
MVQGGRVVEDTAALLAVAEEKSDLGRAPPWDRCRAERELQFDRNAEAYRFAEFTPLPYLCLYLPPPSQPASYRYRTPHITHIHDSLTMATQRLSNVLSHITPGKTPLEQMYVCTPSPLPTTFPRLDSIT